MWMIYIIFMFYIPVEKYFSELTTTCVLWHNNFDFDILPSLNNNVYMQIYPTTLNTSFADDIYNFAAQDKRYNSNDVYYNDLIKKLIAALEMSHCEGFVVFQDDIPLFAEAFRKASAYSIWRTTYSRFLFVYTKENQQEDLFKDIIFKNQANILVIESQFMNSSTFALKTNKFTGSIFEQPEELILLSEFNALTNSFSPDINLFPPEKLLNLQRREIIVGAFDYRPFVAVDFERLPLYYDHSQDNPTHLVHADGAEMRIVHVFCEIYNCTVQFDTSEKEEWGTALANYSGTGLIGMIIDGKIHMAMGAMYAWYSDYIAIDITTFIGRSGVTCLVPAPTRMVNWWLPLRPFQFTLWCAVSGCLVLEAISLLIARRFEQNLENLQGNTWWSCTQFGYILSLKLFVSQGSDYIVNSHTVRMVLFACYMIDIIITTLYGGGLSAILTLPALEETADSLERLYKHDIPWTATSYDWIESITSDDEDNDAIYESDIMFKRLLANYEVNTIDEMREKSLTRTMGFVLERMEFGHFGNGDFITPAALDRLKLMVDDIYSQFCVAMVPRLWAHISKYNDFILAWHSSGFDKFWEWKITADYLNVNEQNQVQASMYTDFDEGPVKLDMKNFAGLMILWIVGTVISIFGFMGELVYYKLVNRSETERKCEISLVEKEK